MEDVKRLEELIQWHTEQIQELRDSNPGTFNVCFATLVGEVENDDSKVMGIISSHPEFTSYLVTELFKMLPSVYQIEFLLQVATQSISGLGDKVEEMGLSEKKPSGEKESSDPNKDLN